MLADGLAMLDVQVGVRVEEEEVQTGARHHCCSAYLTFVSVQARCGSLGFPQLLQPLLKILQNKVILPGGTCLDDSFVAQGRPVVCALSLTLGFGVLAIGILIVVRSDRLVATEDGDFCNPSWHGLHPAGLIASALCFEAADADFLMKWEGMQTLYKPHLMAWQIWFSVLSGVVLLDVQST